MHLWNNRKDSCIDLIRRNQRDRSTHKNRVINGHYNLWQRKKGVLKKKRERAGDYLKVFIPIIVSGLKYRKARLNMLSKK